MTSANIPLPIITVTLNPALDEAVSLDRLVVGGTNRCRLESLDPGGKGINASRMICRLGRPTLALGFVGGVSGGMIRDRLSAEGVPHDLYEVDGLTRLNVMVYESDTAQRTRLYLPGAEVAREQFERLRCRLAAVAPGSVVVLGGSVPPGLTADVYAELVSLLRVRGIRTVVDTSEKALASVLPARPNLIKPNAEEAAELVGRPLTNDEEVFRAAEELRSRGAEYVVISLGAKGAIAVGPTGGRKAVPPCVIALSAVGSGDSMVAGMAVALAEGGTLDDMLRLGTAAGAATAKVPGTQLGDPREVERLLRLVAVCDVEPVKTLTDNAAG